MSNITIIPARPQRANSQQNETEKPKLRVAAYCRVSTDSDEQATSYEAQVSHYTEQITRNPEWAFAGIYADDGISGTNTKKREEFNRMIADCMDGKIDMIITKSISRFARNTLDCLKYIRQLKDRNIPVFFEKENINTLDAKGEVLLTIMASLAQQESQSLSQNVKLGLQFRYQRGEVQVNHSRFLGYTKDENGRLVIDPEQAEVVRRIYREYLDGYSTDKIAAGLERDGILTGAGNPRWHTSTVAKILRNEKYMGDALLQKTYTVDYLSKKRIKNNGIMPQYYVENDTRSRETGEEKRLASIDLHEIETSLRKAGEVHKEARSYIQSKIKPEMRFWDLCCDWEDKVRSLIGENGPNVGRSSLLPRRPVWASPRAAPSITSPRTTRRTPTTCAASTTAT